MRKAITCCFTGHRPEKLPWGYDEADPRCGALKERLKGAVEEAYGAGMRHFMCGMAQGADFYFCEAVLEAKARLSGITLEAVIPCEEQAARWPEPARNRYFQLVSQCDVETLVQPHYDRGCMLRRDRYMVDRSSMLIAVFNGLLGGTMYTIAYAEKKELEVLLLEPEGGA